MKQLLLLSSSRVGDSGYLEAAVDQIAAFLPDSAKRVAFVPFAGVTIGYAQYTQMVSNALSALGLEFVDIGSEADPLSALDQADAVFVGGGNTFALLKQLYATGLLQAIRDRVNAGMPYVGWSAGSNVAGASIRTTNDMPIVEPPSFDALALVPFQLNPHYTDYVAPGHNGETRRQRLEEFLVLNPDAIIYGLPEGTGLLVRDQQATVVGQFDALKLAHRQPVSEIKPGASFVV